MLLDYTDDPMEKALSPARVNALLAVKERGSWIGAKNATKKGVPAVKLQIKELEAAFGFKIIEEKKGGRVGLTPDGEALADHARVIKLRFAAARRQAAKHAVSVAGLPHHAQFVLPLIERLVQDRINEHAMFDEYYLDETHRSTFEEDAISLLEHEVYDLVLGLPPDEGEERHEVQLHTVAVYTARLEAMVTRAYEGDALTLEQLVTDPKHQLLVPSVEFRSRRLLEESIERSGIVSRPVADRVRLESHVTKVLIRYGWRGHGTVVVPSDIALPYKEGEDFAGPTAANFKWVPIIHNGETLTHDVHATIRADDERTQPVLEVLQDVIAKIPELEGGNPPVPNPRNGHGDLAPAG